MEEAGRGRNYNGWFEQDGTALVIKVITDINLIATRLR